jgi:acyl-CoA synthetase (AMP-forming)/AMP-acid ligase II
LWPEEEAVVDGEKRFNYKQVLHRSTKLAHLLEKHGLERGDVISILSPNSHYFLEGYFACAMANLIFNPINFRLSAREVAVIMQDAGSKLLLAHDDFSALAHDSRELCGQKPILVPLSGLESYLSEDSGGEIGELMPCGQSGAVQDVAHLYYTSGTTGEPKGVMLTHSNVVIHAFCTIAELHLSDKDIWLHAAPMFHLADAWATFAITAVGGKHVILPYFQAQPSLSIIERERVTVTNLIPTMLNAMLNDPSLQLHRYTSLRLILSGGAPISPDSVRRIITAFACDYVQTYGMTETSPYLTLSIPKAHMKNWSEDKLLAVRSKTGRPFMAVELRVVREDGSEVSKNNLEVGEIVVRGSTVTPGYWKKPMETEMTIREGWLHTGDLAVIDDEGYVNIVDRKKDMIITGGENVYSTEVENVLYEHPSVLECAVFGVPDIRWGEAVTAAVVLRRGYRSTAEDLIEFSRTRIAHYKAPRAIRFLTELPKTGSGKIQKKALRDL